MYQKTKHHNNKHQSEPRFTNKLISLISVVIICLSMMTTLLSCSKVEIYDYHEEIVTVTSGMNQVLVEFGDYLDREKELLIKSQTIDEYDAFVKEEVGSVETYENQFGQEHLKLIQLIDQISIHESGDYEDLLTRLEQMNQSYTHLIQQMLNYHYMMVHSQLLLYQFDITLEDLTNYMVEGHITTIDFNDGLNRIMSQNDGLLNLDSLNTFEIAANDELSRIDDVLNQIHSVKISLDELEALTEVDLVVKAYVLDMFTQVEGALDIVYTTSTNFYQSEFSGFDLNSGVSGFVTDSIQLIDDEFNPAVAGN